MLTFTLKSEYKCIYKIKEHKLAYNYYLFDEWDKINTDDYNNKFNSNAGEKIMGGVQMHKVMH